MANSAYEVQKAYLAFFGRPADPVGLYVWSNTDFATMINGFAASAEYNALYSGMTTEQRVNQVYQNLLGRPAETAGLAYWVNEFNSGRVNVGTLAQSIQNGAQGTDAVTVQSRITYATNFTASLNTLDQINGYSGNVAASNARSAVSMVTSDTTTLTTALTNLSTVTAGIVAGVSPKDALAAAQTPTPTFTLTESGHAVTLTGTSTDAFVYTLNGAATRAGSAVSASSGSLTNSVTSFDSSGYSGTSNLTLAAGSNSITGGSASETVNVLGLNVTGTIALAGGLNHVTAATGAIMNTTITATGGTADLTLASGASVTMNAANYKLFNANNGTTGITAPGTEQITLSDVLNGGTPPTLNVNVETFVLANGANNVKLGFGAQNVTAAGGDDTLHVGGSTVTGAINLGAGTNHVYASSGAVLNTTITAASGSADLNLSAGDIVTMNAANYNLFNSGGIIGATGSERIILSDALNGATLNANIEFFQLAAASNSVTSGAANQTIVATALTAGQTLTLAGTHNVTVTLNGGNLNSTSSGNLTVIDAAAGTITTGSGTDTITGSSAGNNTIDGGAGADTISLGTHTSADQILISTVAGGTDTVSGFDTTKDLLKISAAIASKFVQGNETAITPTVGAAVQNVSSAGAFTMAAATNVIAISGSTFANDNALIQALAISGGTGTYALTMATAAVLNDDILVVYSDGTNSHVVAVDLGAATTTFTLGQLTVADVAVINNVGVVGVAALAGQISFV